MKITGKIAALVALGALLACQSSCSDDEGEVKEDPIVVVDPPIDEGPVIVENPTIDTLAQGFTWTEGPLYIADGDFLLFSDIPNNSIFKWTEAEGKSLYLKPSGYTGIFTRRFEPGSNGLLLNADGQLVLCQQGDRRMAVMESPLSDPKPEFKTLADKYEGKQLNSPNDAVYHSNGDMYFTDPPFGLDDPNSDPNKELDFHGVFRLKQDGTLDLITKDLSYPNGITLSPDEKTLYVSNSDTDNPIWMAYELGDDGLPVSERVFYDAKEYKGKDMGLPDGMKTNKRGYVFATGPEGLWVFTPEGEVEALVKTGQLTSNVALSPDEKYAFLTADDYVFRVNLKE